MSWDIVSTSCWSIQIPGFVLLLPFGILHRDEIFKSEGKKSENAQAMGERIPSL